MTTTNPVHDREVIQRASQLFDRDKDLVWDDAVRQAGEQVEAERTQRAAQQARSDKTVESFRQMACTCGACGGARLPSAPDALCDRCRAVDRMLTAEAAAVEQVEGRTRRALVEALRDRRAKAGQS